MKMSKTGKPLCCRCRKLATQKQDFPQHTGTTITLYYCGNHARPEASSLKAKCKERDDVQKPQQ